MISTRPTHSLISALLTTRRGVILVTLSLLTVYFVFFSSSTSTATTREPGGVSSPQGVRGWAKEYWNWRSSTTPPRSDDERQSLGDLKQLKEDKRKKLELEQQQRQQESHLYPEGGGWKKVESFNSDDEEEEELISDHHHDDDYAPAIDYQEGEEKLVPVAPPKSDKNSVLLASEQLREAALADSPRVAIEDEALNRAPMAALGSPPPPPPPTNSNEDDDDRDEAPLNRKEGLNDHAAAKVVKPEEDEEKGDSKPQNERLQEPKPPLPKKLERKPKPKPKAVAGKPKKIGTGGKVVKPEQVLAGAGAGEGEGGAIGSVGGGGGEKAGKVVQAEAGKRVGTGARPGAKGMGLERVEGIAPERRRLQRKRLAKW